MRGQVVLPIAVAAAIIIAGCGNQGDSSTSRPSNAPSSASKPDPTVNPETQMTKTVQETMSALLDGDGAGFCSRIDSTGRDQQMDKIFGGTGGDAKALIGYDDSMSCEDKVTRIGSFFRMVEDRDTKGICNLPSVKKQLDAQGVEAAACADHMRASLISVGAEFDLMRTAIESIRVTNVEITDRAATSTVVAEKPLLNDKQDWVLEDGYWKLAD